MSEGVAWLDQARLGSQVGGVSFTVWVGFKDIDGNRLRKKMTIRWFDIRKIEIWNPWWFEEFNLRFHLKRPPKSWKFSWGSAPDPADDLLFLEKREWNSKNAAAAGRLLIALDIVRTLFLIFRKIEILDFGSIRVYQTEKNTQETTQNECHVSVSTQ